MDRILPDCVIDLPPNTRDLYHSIDKAMNKIFTTILIGITLFWLNGIAGQNVGINTTVPVEKLDVNGKIKLGDDSTTSGAGTIRWNAATNDFEGYNGTEWLSLTRSNSNVWPENGNVSGHISDYVLATSNDGDGDDYFGATVSISGNYAIVGAPFDDVGGNMDQGSAYVFINTGTTWVQQTKLTASDGAALDYFGRKVSIHGNYAVISAPQSYTTASNQGSAYIFMKSGTSWIQQAILTASDGDENAFFGYGAFMFEDYVIIGSPGKKVGPNSNQGSAYVFQRNGSTWTQQAILLAADGNAEDFFGTSVSMNGLYVVVGASYDQVGLNTNQGSGYIFLRSGSTWAQQAHLIAADGQLNDHLGISVSIFGDYAVLGAEWAEIMSNYHQGSVYLFSRTGSTWTQKLKLVAPNGSANALFGFSVFLTSDYLIVGAYNAESTADCEATPVMTGLAYIYKNQNTIWTLHNIVSDPLGEFGDQFGFDVSMSGNRFLVGAVYADPNGVIDQGKVVFGKTD